MSKVNIIISLVCDFNVKLNFQTRNNQNYLNNSTNYVDVTKLLNGVLYSPLCHFEIKFNELEVETEDYVIIFFIIEN